MTAELCFVPATELVTRYRARTLSPVEVARAVLDRIAALNPKLNAYFLVDADGALSEHMRRFHERWDLLATPAAAVPAFDVGRIPPATGRQGDADDWMGWTPFTYPFNLTQQPAPSVPYGFTSEGLPVGLQLVAPQYREDLALRAAHAFQSATDHLRRPAV